MATSGRPDGSEDSSRDRFGFGPFALDPIQVETVRIVIEDGFGWTTLGRVAEATGLTNEQVLAQYPSVEAVLESILLVFSRTVEAALKTLPVVANPSIEQRRTTIQTVLDIAVSGRPVIQLVHRMPNRYRAAMVEPILDPVRYDIGVRLLGADFASTPAKEQRALAALATMVALVDSAAFKASPEAEDITPMIDAIMAACGGDVGPRR